MKTGRNKLEKKNSEAESKWGIVSGDHDKPKVVKKRPMKKRSLKSERIAGFEVDIESFIMG